MTFNQQMETDSSIKSKSQQSEAKDFVPVLFKRRWLMLMLFSSVSLLNAFQWLHINIVAPSSVYFWNRSLPGYILHTIICQ